MKTRLSLYNLKPETLDELERLKKKLKVSSRTEVLEYLLNEEVKAEQKANREIRNLRTENSILRTQNEFLIEQTKSIKEIEQYHKYIFYSFNFLFKSLQISDESTKNPSLELIEFYKNLISKIDALEQKNE